MSETQQTELSDVNAMDADAFVALYGDVAEHSPWVARQAAAMRPFANRADMIKAFALAVAGASVDRQLELICAHPDLAGKAALRGDLTEDSRSEQAGAGLDSLSPEEFEAFGQLNSDYKTKFGFPFIFAVKGATKHMILAAFAKRLNNAPTEEFQEAISQISNILRFRLEERVNNE